MELNMDWVRAAMVRAIKVFATTLIALIGNTAVAITELDWPQMISVATTALVVSILSSIAGLPEVDAKNEIKDLKGEIHKLKNSEDNDLENDNKDEDEEDE